MNYIGTPRAGYYRTRLIRGGIMVPVEIWFGRPIIDGEVQDRSPRWCCMVDGRTDREDFDDDGNYLGRVPLDPILDDVWTHCCDEPISYHEYEFLTRRRRWAKDNDPEHPAANPHEPIDVRKLKPAF
jgi:hypothetical protein